jgi:hypothetical protein
MFKGRFSNDGLGLIFSDFFKRKLKEYIKENPNAPFTLTPVYPESGKMRGYFEGGICPLMTFYQEGMDHRNANDVRQVREWLKLEFNGEIVSIRGKTHRVAQSTKYKLNSGFLERVIDYMTENYAPPDEVLDTKKYLYWKDVIYPHGGPDNYIDYLTELNILKK